MVCIGQMLRGEVGERLQEGPPTLAETFGEPTTRGMAREVAGKLGIDVPNVPNRRFLLVETRKTLEAETLSRFVGAPQNAAGRIHAEATHTFAHEAAG